MAIPSRTDVTDLLVDLSRGDQEALNKLMPLVYDELHRLASRYLRNERPGRTHLLLAGRNDFIFPVETSQKPLFKLLGTPADHKRHVVFEGAGHVPPRIEVIRETLDWLDRYLGPVGR